MDRTTDIATNTTTGRAMAIGLRMALDIATATGIGIATGIGPATVMARRPGTGAITATRPMVRAWYSDRRCPTSRTFRTGTAACRCTSGSDPPASDAARRRGPRNEERPGRYRGVFHGPPA